MKKSAFWIMTGCLFCMAAAAFPAKAQRAIDTTARRKKWECNAQLYFYGTPDNSFLMPVFNATREHLFLQSRYNYEDLQTFSAFAGYKFEGGKKLAFEITPMMGFMVGNTKGLAPEVDINLTYGSFNLSSETEYLANFEYPKLSYLNTWNEFTYYPTDWLYAGISAQRMRIFRTQLDIQRGIVAGATVGRFTFMGYLFNFLSNEHDIFGMLGVNFAF
jgi:hypothetical protein